MYYENEKEKRLITELCDLALRAGGLQNKKAVDYILDNLKPPEVEAAKSTNNKRQ